ncbi:MAG: RNA-binding S4 domain-containing protein [Bosea sp.]|uniref:RNA-binding S4 domain-containing protein n=1 Tax=Bosea sp. (in: a-proteobacteria) TaxID=1871050 RepID=UPI001AC1962F|nr:S4 domain-containing protein [Bosea sp. (in: a-proteobacteria)]MBN9470955.1 RNA-binding S4 domain-containing protein [Bosea sp. (in: a-proteobacteria)]
MREDRQRLDKWLWFARFARNRSAAVRLVEDGHVRVAGKRIENPALGLKLGDVLTLALPHATLVVALRALGERRGSYEQARTLYEVLGGDQRGDASLAPGEPKG